MKKLLLNAIFIVIFALYGMSSLTAKPLGYHYILGFPANDKEESTKDIIAVFVASEYNGTFQLINGLTGLNKSYAIKAGDVRRLTTKEGDASWDWENRTIGKAEPNGIEIISDVPISVNVLIGKAFSSEGYTAIPVEAWGKKYIHNSYYDFNESRPWRTEFLIIASEDNTIINVNLKGMPEGAATADPNWKIGQTKTIKLNKYETYLVQGDGLTRGLFDMSGTEITADKPIAIISGHERCMVPKNIVMNGRDHLLAMLPPVDNWGKEYYTIELDRGTDRGDYFRVVASEDSTDVDISWYDKKTKEKINSIWYKNLGAGEWVEYHTVDADYTTYQESIRGLSHFKANNPILVCQYAYSAFWDSQDSRFDPFYFPLTSVEQFVHTTVFQAPSNKSGNDYVENYLNIIAIGDTSDINRNEEILSSITIDGKTVRSYMDEFITNRIPGSNLYWATVRLAQGTHIIEGDTKFGGYIYGFGMYNSYAWPIHSANLDLTSEEFDYLPPKVVKKQNNNGRFDINIVDNTSYQNDDSVQTDAGVDKFPKVVSQENFSKFESGYFQLSEEEYDPPRLNKEWRGETDTDLHIFAEVKDKKQNAKLIFKAKDIYGNYVIDSLLYNANNIELLSNNEFAIKEHADTTLTLRFHSLNISPLEILQVNLQKYTFSNILYPTPLEPNSNFEININAKSNSTAIINDTLVIQSIERTSKFPLTFTILFDENLNEELTINKDIIFFNNKDNPNQDKYEITYNSKGDTEVKSYELSQNNLFKLVSTTIGDTLKPNDKIDAIIEFTPVEKGTFYDTLLIETSRKIHTFPIQGTYDPNSVENKLFNKLSLSPNPVNGDVLSLEYELKYNSHINISIIDLKGNTTIVENEIRNKFLKKDIDVSNLTKGVYFLKIDINGKSIKKKFIKE